MATKEISTTTDLTEDGKRAVEALAGRVSRRTKGALVRNSFVRAKDPQHPAPLAALAATKGRGAGVPLKFYLALLWLSAKPPYDTQLAASAWARVLDLPDPDNKGARRIRDAQDRLTELNLITSEVVGGSPNKILLLKEDGSGHPYSVPYETIRKNQGSARSDGYFKVPTELWTSGQIQNMNSAALVMLLIVLEEARGKNAPQWWSMQTFEDRFSISKDVRARGTRELKERGLLVVESMPVSRTPGASILEDKRVRNTYILTGEANRDWDPLAAFKAFFGPED